MDTGDAVVVVDPIIGDDGSLLGLAGSHVVQDDVVALFGHFEHAGQGPDLDRQTRLLRHLPHSYRDRADPVGLGELKLGELDKHEQPEVFYVDPKKGLAGLQKIFKLQDRPRNIEGVDIAVLYPTMGLGLLGRNDIDPRLALGPPTTLRSVYEDSMARERFLMTLLLVFAVVMGGLIVWKHRTNIARLRAGTESRFGGAPPVGPPPIVGQ